jgi:hypothetical protein
MMFVCQELVHLNNDAVAAIHSDPQTSLALFHSALLKTSELIASSGLRSSESSPHHESYSSATKLTGSLAIVDCAYVGAISLTPSHASAFSQDPLVTLAMMFAVLEFNQGVLHHLYGLNENNSCSTHLLTHAQKCYSNAREILSRIADPESSQGNALVDFLMLCIFNNMAQISCLLSDHATAQQQLQNLSVYAGTIQSDNHDSSTFKVLDWFKRTFLGHMQILKLPNAAAAA